MFHKPFRVKSSNTIRGSDRKKWKSCIEKRFPKLLADDLDTLLPAKADVTVTKLKTHGETFVNVLFVQKNPVFFELDDLIYPTVYSLWTHPHMVPVFTTLPDVLQRLKGGADLMLPGVVLPNVPENGPRPFSQIVKDRPCSVNLVDTCAVAVGKTAMSGREIVNSAMRGKVVIILHTYEDQLWAMGTRSCVPSLSKSPSSCEPIEREGDVPVDQVAERVANSSLASNVLVATDVEGNNVVVESETTEDGSRFKSMDDLLYYCFLKALKTTAKKAEYPLRTGTFFSAHVIASAPSGHSINIKKTSYKKLTTFLQSMQEKKFLQVTELIKGVESIVSVNFDHPEIRQFVVDKSDSVADSRKEDDEKNSEGARRLYEPPVIEELYLVSAAVLPLFKLCGYSKSSCLSASEVRSAVTKYVRDNNLQRDSFVTMDPVLSDVLLDKKERSTVPRLKWDEIHARCMGKMNLGYKLKFPGKEAVIRKGTVDPIEFTIEQRTANKKVTLIHNLEVFGIDPHELAHTVQVSVATSTSVSPAANRKEGFQVLVQGNHVAFIGKLLTEEYGILRKYIRGLELAPKSKKR